MTEKKLKPKKEKEKKFNTTHYQEIHDLVWSYKDGDRDAAGQIIERFEPFFSRYITLIKKGQYDLAHYSTRSFMLLYSGSKEQRTIVKSHMYRKGASTEADKLAVQLYYIFEAMTEEDIKHELYVVILKMAKNYKDLDRPSFHTYIDRCFHFYLQRHFAIMSRDPSRGGNVDIIDNIDYDKYNCCLEMTMDEDYGEADIRADIHYNIKYSNHMTFEKSDNTDPFDDSSFFNNNWTNGVTCHDLFLCLTPFERRLIYMYYVQKMSDSKIATELNVCRTTIGKKRTTALDKLKAEKIKLEDNN